MLSTVEIFGDADFAQRIQRGDVATDLVRPVHPLRAGLASDYGRSLYHASSAGCRRSSSARIVFDLTAPTNPVVWAVFLVSVMLAIAVSFAFRFLYNLSAFWLLDYRGAMRIAVALAAFFSGFIIPVASSRTGSRRSGTRPVPEHAAAPGRRLPGRVDRDGARRDSRDAGRLGGRADRVCPRRSRGGRESWSCRVAESLALYVRLVSARVRAQWQYRPSFGSTSSASSWSRSSTSWRSSSSSKRASAGRLERAGGRVPLRHQGVAFSRTSWQSVTSTCCRD